MLLRVTNAKQSSPNLSSPIQPSASYQQRDQMLCNRLCIRHMHLIHSYFIDQTDPPECNNCRQLLSVKHLLTECTSYNWTWHNYYSLNDIKDKQWRLYGGARATPDETLPSPPGTPIQTRHEICIAMARTCRPPTPCLPLHWPPSHQRLEPPLNIKMWICMINVK